jgi:hypothetical protein
MGLRFRKVFSLGGLLRLNISKTGIGVGVGPRGFSLSIGSKGIRKSVGIPGSGLSYQDTKSWKKLNEVADAPAEQVDLATNDENHFSENSASTINLWKIAFVLLVVAISVWYFISSNQKLTHHAEALHTIAPAPNRPLTPPEIREVQTLLNQKGYRAGPADGVGGPKTMLAAKAYLKAKGLQPLTDLDLHFLTQLRAQ